MINDHIAIRSIQHWLYCPHRWGLLEVDCAWAENYYVTKANLLHKRVHNANSYTSKAKTSYTSVTVYNDLPQYKIYGITDCLEITDGKYSLVEYKPTKPKNEDYNYEDLMQVFAQKICVDYVFGCDCDGYIYYADVKKKVKLPISEKFDYYNESLINSLSQMRSYLDKGIIPLAEKGQKCSGCSMKDICMPNFKKKTTLAKSINMLLEEDYEKTS